MDLKKIIFVTIFVLIVLALNGQKKKNHYEISFGAQYLQNKSVFSFQPYFDCANGAYDLEHIKEQSLILPTFSLLRYHQTCVNNLSFISGVGYDQKGFLESAFLIPWESPSEKQCYRAKHILNYLGLQLGLDYTILQFKSVTLSISQIINSEILINRRPLKGDIPDYLVFIYPYKIYAFSSKTCLNIGLPFYKNSSLVIKPFFQTALTNYNVKRTDFNGHVLNNNYRPFGFGCSLGLSF